MGALAALTGVMVDESTYAPKSMYLDKINSNDDPRLLPPPAKRAEDPLYYPKTSTRDIDGAQPKSFSTYTNRGDEAMEQMAKIWPTEKYMHPTKLHPETYTRPEPESLSSKDIRGASPAEPKFKLLARDTNPLQPRYKLQSHEPQPAPEPRFLRDSMPVTDIEGTATVKFQPTREGFTTLGADDIEGAYVGWKPYYRAHFNTPQGERDHINVADINTTTLKTFATRAPYPDGDVEGSKPRPRTRHREGDYLDLSLKNSDIEGATRFRTADTVSDPWAGKIQRRHEKPEFLSTADILGARARDALIPAVTKKHTAAVSDTDRRRDAQMVATGTLTALAADTATVRELSCKLKGWDKDGSGKVSAPEFLSAIRSSGLDLDSKDMQSLKSGLTDHAGLVNYRPFMQTLAASTARIEKQRTAKPPQHPQKPISKQGSWVARSQESSSRPQSAPCMPSKASSPRASQPRASPEPPPTPPRAEPVRSGQSTPRGTGAVPQGPHYANVADIVARAGEMAEQRKARAQSARTVSFKAAHTRERGPKYWFGSSGISHETYAINTAWRASSDPTMLGQNKSLMTAAQGLQVDDSTERAISLQAAAEQQQVALTSRPNTAGSGRPSSGKWTSAASSSMRPVRDRPGTATMRAGSLDRVNSAKNSRPSTARMPPRNLATGSDYTSSFGPREVMPHKMALKAPTPVYRPAPRPTAYTSGARQERELIKQDMATVRSLA